MTVALAVASGPGVASAGEPLAVPVRISEVTHAGCPKEPALRERLEVHLGHIRAPAEGEPAIDLAIEVEKRGELSIGTLTLTAAGASVQRAASSTSCEDVLAALTMMAVIAIGEQAERLSPEPSKEAGAPSSAEPPERQGPQGRRGPAHAHPPTASTSRRGTNVPSKPEARPVRPSTAASSKSVSFALGSGVELNDNRGPVVLGTWFAQITFPAPFDPALRVGVARSTRERASIAPGAIAIRWSELIWAVCADVHRDRGFRVGPCLNGELGSLQASVIRPLPAHDVPSPWFSLGASAKATWRILPPLDVEVMAGVRAPILRRELFFEPLDYLLAYRAPMLVPFADLGFVVHLP